MRKLAIAGIIALALPGCMQTVDQMSYPELQRLAAELKQRCTSYGLKPGSAEHNTCYEVEANREVAVRRDFQQRRRAAAARSVSCYRYGNSVNCF
jgi:hypothetical protein